MSNAIHEALLLAVRSLDPAKVQTFLNDTPGVSINAMMPATPGHSALHAVCAEAESQYRRRSTRPVPADAAARCARSLIEFGAAVNSRDSEGNTPLMIALVSLNQPLINVLLESGARADLGSLTNHCNSFHIAAREGDARAMRLLLRTAHAHGVDVSSSIELTPLCSAAKRGKLDVVAVILDYHLSQPKRESPVVELKDVPSDVSEISAVMWLAAGEGQADVVRYLARQGGDAAVKDGTSLLSYLAVHGTDNSAAVVDVLLAEPRIKTQLKIALASAPEIEHAIRNLLAARSDAPKLAARLDEALKVGSEQNGVLERRRPSSSPSM